MAKMNFGEPSIDWAEYGLREYPLEFNTGESGHKAIVKDVDGVEALVAIVKNRYKLIPNERVVKVADEAAEMAGLVPFDKFKGPWIIPMRNNDHVIRTGWKIHALYASNEPFFVETQHGDDEMYVGVAVHNSIDRTMGFTAGSFTFRKACSNVVLSAGMKDWSYDYNRLDHGKTIEYLYQRHTKGMEIVAENLKEILLTMMERSQVIMDTYNQMAKLKINKSIMEGIRKTPMPKKLYPEYIPAPKVPLTDVVPDVTQWRMYNDFTQAIWHNQKAQMNSKLSQFKYLHTVLPFEAAPQ